MKKYFDVVHSYFKGNKERCLTLLVVLILTLLSSITLIAYSFYQNKSKRLIISGVALIDSSDVSIKVYRENKNDSGTGIGTYSLSYYVPSASSYNYNSSKTKCSTGISITKYENQKFYVDATKKGKCEVYFDAIDGYIDDYEVNLFVQEVEGSTDDKNYKQMGMLPLYESGYYYTVNTSKTNCTNGATVTIVGKTINVLTTKKAVCNVYADKNIDNEAPTISEISVSSDSITTTLNDNIKLLSYGISASNTVEPDEWIDIPTTPYTLNTNVNKEGTYYIWVKDTSNNLKLSSNFTISLGTAITTLLSTSTPDVYDENGLRYEGADPNNYICLDSKTDGACSNTSLLFRIIGLFDEEYSTDGTTSAGTMKLLKILDTNNYGGSTGKYWSGSSSNQSNNWSKSTLNTELNGTYLHTLLSKSVVNSKLESAIITSKWHLGGANATSTSNYYYSKITTENWYKAERSPYATSETLQNLYSGNPEYVYAKVGLMYPSDYGYATVGGSTISKENCRAKELYKFDSSSYSDCKNNDWIYKSQSISWGSNNSEWLISPYASTSSSASYLNSSGFVNAKYNVYYYQFAVRPTFYLNSNILKIVGGEGTKDNAYRLG